MFFSSSHWQEVTGRTLPQKISDRNHLRTLHWVLGYTGIHIHEFPNLEHWNLNTDEGIEAMLARSWSTCRSHTDSLWENWGSAHRKVLLWKTQECNRFSFLSSNPLRMKMIRGLWSVLRVLNNQNQKWN